MRPFLLIIFCFLFNSAFITKAQGDDSTRNNELDRRVGQLEWQVDQLEREIDDATGLSIALFLFGVFCALWAQNTGRNAWLWFFLGLFLSVITVIVLLIKNANDKTCERAL
jgi:hypothetical protein